MATPIAVRRGGSPLLRALAVGGFAAVAWFLCAGVATANEDHSDEAAKTHDAVNVALDGQQAVDTVLLLAETVPQEAAPFVSVTLAPQPFESAQSFESSSIAGVEASVVEFTGADVLEHRLPTVMAEPEADRHPSDSDAYPSHSDTGGYSYTGYPAHTGGHSASGGYSNGYSHSGTVSNTMPAPLYEAKVAAKTAAREAAVRAATPELPPAVPATAPARTTALPFAPSTEPSPATFQVAPNTDVIWEAPEPSAPAPTPKQAPAPSAPTASSGSASDGGGGHRGGVIASLTGQANLKPSAAWSVERWDDGRSPGSVPGLPSTSPD